MAKQTINKLGSVKQTCGHQLHEWIGHLFPLLHSLGDGFFLDLVKERNSQMKQRENEQRVSLTQ
jgi:hypothetical protein